MYLKCVIDYFYMMHSKEKYYSESVRNKSIHFSGAHAQMWKQGESESDVCDVTFMKCKNVNGRSSRPAAKPETSA